MCSRPAPLKEIGNAPTDDHVVKRSTAAPPVFPVLPRGLPAGAGLVLDDDVVTPDGFFSPPPSVFRRRVAGLAKRGARSNRGGRPPRDASLDRILARSAIDSPVVDYDSDTTTTTGFGMAVTPTGSIASSHPSSGGSTHSKVSTRSGFVHIAIAKGGYRSGVVEFIVGNRGDVDFFRKKNLSLDSLTVSLIFALEDVAEEYNSSDKVIEEFSQIFLRHVREYLEVFLQGLDGTLTDLEKEIKSLFEKYERTTSQLNLALKDLEEGEIEDDIDLKRILFTRILDEGNNLAERLNNILLKAKKSAIAEDKKSPEGSPLISEKFKALDGLMTVDLGGQH